MDCSYQLLVRCWSSTVRYRRFGSFAGYRNGAVCTRERHDAAANTSHDSLRRWYCSNFCGRKLTFQNGLLFAPQLLHRLPAADGAAAMHQEQTLVLEGRGVVAVLEDAVVVGDAVVVEDAVAVGDAAGVEDAVVLEDAVAVGSAVVAVAVGGAVVAAVVGGAVVAVAAVDSAVVAATSVVVSAEDRRRRRQLDAF